MKVLPRTVAAILAGSFLLIAGCSDPLDLEPQDELPSGAVFENADLASSYLSGIYENTGWGFGNPMIAGGADEAKNTHGHGDAPVRQSNMISSDRGFWDWCGNGSIEKFCWENAYSSVRNINIFLSNIEQSDGIAASTRETMAGEAYFLRAFFYHNLLRLYGGVPLVDETFELGEDLKQFQVPRGSFEETVEFIVADLDRAADRLSMEPRRGGSATRGAALALKSRVLLFAASDLFAADKSPFDMEAVRYTGGDQQQRWQRAKEAAQAVIDLGVYRLPQAESAEAYHAHLLREDNPEFIWARYFNESGGEAHNHSLWVSPNGWNSWTGDAPTQQHVNAYEMRDGSEFEWEGGDPMAADEPVDVQNPYDDRDPRLRANILVNGVKWRQRSTLQPQDPEGVYQPGWYELPGESGLQPGLDTREGPLQDWNGTWTGYNLIKFVDPSIDPNTEQAYNPWPYLRYAEILLNYAEASAELGDRNDAVQALNEVRSRVGMPDVPTDGGPNRTLLERVRQEREVELAFEEHRYFDVRRWMIAPEVYGGAKGVRIEGELPSDAGDLPNSVHELILGGHYNFKYNVRRVDERRWQERSYFLPFVDDELNRNPELEQNPGY